MLYVAVSCMHNNVISKYVWACASRCEHIILPISSTTIFSVLIKTKWYMLGANIRWLCSDATYNIEAIRGLSQKFVDNRHLTFFNENKELKPISWYTSMNMRGLSRKWLESIQKYWNYITFQFVKINQYTQHHTRNKTRSSTCPGYRWVGLL